MKILIMSADDPQRSMFNPYARDRVLEATILWKQDVESRGHTVEWAYGNDVSTADVVLFWDGQVARTDYGRNVLAECKRFGVRYVLILLEPPVVQPDNYDPAFLADFPIVLTWNDDMADGKQFRKWHWAQPDDTMMRQGLPFGERKYLCAISGNKTSAHHDELYTARVRDYDWFGRQGHLHLYGTGWPSIPFYRGVVASKLDVFREYRFALVYENGLHSGYITEKVFDALRGGIVPVYWGDKQFIPGTLRRTDFATPRHLHDRLSAMEEGEWEMYREQGRAYLRSKDYTKYLPAHFIATLNEALGC